MKMNTAPQGSAAPDHSRSPTKPEIYKTIDGKVIVEDEFLHLLAVTIETLNQYEIVQLALNTFDSEWIESSTKVLLQLCPTTQQSVSPEGPLRDTDNIKRCLKVMRECGDNVPRFVSRYSDNSPAGPSNLGAGVTAAERPTTTDSPRGATWPRCRIMIHVEEKSQHDDAAVEPDFITTMEPSEGNKESDPPATVPEDKTEENSPSLLREFVTKLTERLLTECRLVKHRSQEQLSAYTRHLVDQTVKGITVSKDFCPNAKDIKRVCRAALKDLKKKLGGKRGLETLILSQSPER
ncbi:uncharacterized protein [Trachinotus anak]|uniref:uncharacterized protein n=1 Tax=Trachinotus anak TaxID=443729 RepID=UPI0039F24BB5